MTKKTIVGVMIIVAIAATIIFAGCIEEKAPDITPPLTPVTQGYIQSYNHEFNYGYDYPEAWTMHGHDEFQLTDGVQNVEMFVDEPEGTSITIIAKTNNWKNWDEVINAYREIHPETIVKEKIIEVNGVKGYEFTHWDPSMNSKSKVVIFSVDNMIYEFGCYASEDLYGASEGIFDHVINSFNVQ
ncbi:MAG: PsbP-related protein [Methanosarcinaceae archaeon]